MKNLVKIFLIIICFSLGQIQAADKNVGTSAANFLKIGVDSRAVALGGAYVAIAEGAQTLYWNPAGIASLKINEALFSYVGWIVDTKITYAALVMPLGEIGNIGFSAHLFSSGDIIETTNIKDKGTGRTFTAEDMALSISYSRQLTDKFSFGLTMKYIQEDLAHESASAFAFDIGSLFHTGMYGNLRLGFVMSNFGSQLQLKGRDLETSVENLNGKGIGAQLETTEWQLPLIFRFGIALDILDSENNKITLSGDIVDTRDFNARLNNGLEYALKNMYFLRVGYRSNSSEEGITAGGGINITVPGFREVKLDYAFADLGRFNSIHRFSLALDF